MKKIILAVALMCSSHVMSYAQQGDITVINNTNCVIAYDVGATCPGSCEGRSSLMMTNLGPGKTHNIPASTYPWDGGGGDIDPPPCVDWEWHWADIFICGEYYRVGRSVGSCASYSGGLAFSDECSCTTSGTITINFSINGSGDVLIQIF